MTSVCPFPPLGAGEVGRLPSEQASNLPDLFRWIARFFREYGGAEALASVYEKCAELAEAWLKEDGERLLTYAEAADLSGHSAQTIAKACQKGRLVNRGRKGVPRVRASDVRLAFPPREASRSPTSEYSVDADARFLVGFRSGEQA